jgi:hypothetical protein
MRFSQESSNTVRCRCWLTSVMSAESKGVDLQVDGEIITELVAETNQNGKSPAVEDGSGDEEDAPEPTDGDTVTGSSKAKKKNSKRSRLKKALGVPGQDESSSSSSNPASKLTPEMVEQLLEMNPSLGGEVAGMNKEKAAQILKKLDVADLLTGMVRAAAVFTFSPAGLLIVDLGCQWEEPERHGFLQVLANATCSAIWSVISPSRCP